MSEKETNSSQSPDLNLIEMLWWDLKRAQEKQISANLNELKQLLSIRGDQMHFLFHMSNFFMIECHALITKSNETS